MDKKNYIDKKVEKKIKQLEKFKLNSLKEELSIMASLGLILTAGICASFYINELILGIITISSGIYIYQRKKSKKNAITENIIQKEIDNLESLKDKNPLDEKSKELKKNKVLELSNKQLVNGNELIRLEDITSLTYLLTIIGAIAVSVNPPMCWGIALLALVSNVVCSNKEIKQYKKYQKIEKRIKDLINELDLSEIYKEEEKANEDIIERNYDINKQLNYNTIVQRNYDVGKEKNKVYKKEMN